MKIYIIRHGETNLNTLGLMQGWIDEPLNESGKALARITGRAMKGIRFDCCISSPLVRSVETVELVLKESGRLFGVLTKTAEDGGQGLSERAAVKRIAAELGVSTVTVSVNLPYQSVVYKLEKKSKNAVRCERWRKKAGEQCFDGRTKG